MNILINNIITETYVEGLGKRCAIWFQGCRKRCKGCLNQDTWSFQKGTLYSIPEIMEIIDKIKNLDGVTILGGEPFEQFDALNVLLDSLYEKNISVILFTGYYLDELNLLYPNVINKIAKKCDVLIDGPYIENLKIKHQYIGSSNQQIYVFNKRYEYLKCTADDKIEFEIRIKKNGALQMNGMINDFNIINKVKEAKNGKL